MTAQEGRLGLAAIGNADDLGLWSGTPHNIANALRALGFEVLPIDVTTSLDRTIVDIVASPFVVRHLRAVGLHPAVHRGRLAARESLLLSAVRSIGASEQVSRVASLDGVIQIGTGYRIRHVNAVSYEDMTIPQAVASPEYFWPDVPRRRRASRIRQEAAAYQRLIGATFSTAWAASSAVTQLGCARERAHVVGIGPNFATQAPSRDWEVPQFLFVGREWARKNGDRVVTAFREVRKRVPRAELHLAGDHPRIDEPGVTGHGYLSLRDPAGRATMSHLWATATCCAVPSRFEPAGIIYVEAMHAGIPSIGTVHGGAADIIADAGSTVDPEDQEALVAAMLRYCDPNTAAATGAIAKARSTQFTWEAVARGLLNALGLGG